MPREIDIFVGNRIRDRRIELGVMQAELADAIGITTARLNDTETGLTRTDPNTLVWIAMALDCPLSFLFGLRNKPVVGLVFTRSPLRDNTSVSSHAQ